MQDSFSSTRWQQLKYLLLGANLDCRTLGSVVWAGSRVITTAGEKNYCTQVHLRAGGGYKKNPGKQKGELERAAKWRGAVHAEEGAGGLTPC